MDAQEIAQRFPRTASYSPEWISENGFGGNALWQTEYLCERLNLKPGMRVLDLGCGRAKSSVFLAREFGVQVWATDLWVPATENWQRVRDAGLEDRVFPIYANARALPFAFEFFDAIVAVDCYSYFGTDDLYLGYLTRFVKPGGEIGIVGAGFVKEVPRPVPEHLHDFWFQDHAYCLHSAAWWRNHWERTGLVDITASDAMEDGWKLWLHWHQLNWPHNTGEITTLEKDAGEYLTYNRMVGRRKVDAKISEYVWPDTLSFPSTYEKTPMLRD
jgi:cyclopropane fatty-acyl-phospholipid synthase-like methyltransferase